MESPRHTCLKIEVPSSSEPGETESFFVKGTWFPSRFDIAITDGHDAWICNATGEEVSERASQWDQPVAEYIDLAERYLGFQQAGSVYGFTDAGNGTRRLSWTFEKEGTKLEWRWKCQHSPDSKKTTAGILDFLMDANVRLSEDVVAKTQSSERLKLEAAKCLAQSEKFCAEKAEFEETSYAKMSNTGVISGEENVLVSVGVSKPKGRYAHVSTNPPSSSDETDTQTDETDPAYVPKDDEVGDEDVELKRKGSQKSKKEKKRLDRKASFEDGWDFMANTFVETSKKRIEILEQIAQRYSSNNTTEGLIVEQTVKTMDALNALGIKDMEKYLHAVDTINNNVSFRVSFLSMPPEARTAWVMRGKN